MDYLDDEEEISHRPQASKPSPVTIVALLAAAGAAAMLLWMNLNLSSRVDSLGESIAALQTQKPHKNKHLDKELADISNQLDSVTKALANHLKAHAGLRNPRQGLASAQTGMRTTAPAATPRSNSILGNRTLPPPISSASSVRLSPVQPSAPAPLPTPLPTSSNRGWVVNITSVSDPDSAYQEVQRLRAMGIQAESARAFSNGRVWYRIRVPGFATHDEAAAARPSLEAQLGITDTWVGRRE